jgi:hypothetical protein
MWLKRPVRSRFGVKMLSEETIISRGSRPFPLMAVLLAFCLSVPSSAAVNTAWVRHSVLPSVGSSRDIEARNVNGQVIIAYGGATGVELVKREGATWIVETVIPRPSNHNIRNVDFEVIDGSLYAAASFYQGVFLEDTTAVQIRSNRSGGWQTLYQSVPSTNQYGSWIDLTAVGGNVVASYGGVEAPSLGTGTRRTHFLRESPLGTWTETNLPFFAQGSGSHVSTGAIDGHAVVLRSGSNFVRLIRETSPNTWETAEEFPMGFAQAELREHDHRPVFAAFPKNFSTGIDFVRYFERVDGAWQSTVLDGPGLYLDGSDFEIINGVPTILYVARNDRTAVNIGSIHLRQLIDGVWTEHIVATGEEATYTADVDLLEINGLPAFAAAQTSPQGTPYRLELYQLIPEPINACGLLVALLALRRDSSARQ